MQNMKETKASIFAEYGYTLPKSIVLFPGMVAFPRQEIVF